LNSSNKSAIPDQLSLNVLTLGDCKNHKCPKVPFSSNENVKNFTFKLPVKCLFSEVYVLATVKYEPEMSRAEFAQVKRIWLINNLILLLEESKNGEEFLNHMMKWLLQ